MMEEKKEAIKKELLKSFLKGNKGLFILNIALNSFSYLSYVLFSVVIALIIDFAVAGNATGVLWGGIAWAAMCVLEAILGIIRTRVPAARTFAISCDSLFKSAYKRDWLLCSGRRKSVYFGID